MRVGVEGRDSRRRLLRPGRWRLRGRCRGRRLRVLVGRVLREDMEERTGHDGYLARKVKGLEDVLVLGL